MRIPAPLITVVLAIAVMAAIAWQSLDIWKQPSGLVLPAAGSDAAQASKGPGLNPEAAETGVSHTAADDSPVPVSFQAAAPQASPQAEPWAASVPQTGSIPQSDEILPTNSAPRTVPAQGEVPVQAEVPAQAEVPIQADVPVKAEVPAQPEILAQAASETKPGATQAPPLPSAPNPRPAASAPTAAASQKPAVDETALRYFARQGDTRRLNAEIARLRSLYPDWVPPDDPLQAAPVTDPQLDNMWQLYSQGQFAAARAAIAARQTSEPGWTVPKDLLDRLAIAETRERLVNASNAKQYKMVIDLATRTPSLLTCGDIDVLWRVADAFARTDRKGRTQDTYRYILTNCTDVHDRLSTLQKAEALLSRAEIDPLLALGHTGPDGDEFRPIREDLARNAVAAGGADPRVNVDPGDVKLLEDAADGNRSASDALLLGGYLLQHGDPTQAEHWFRIAFERRNTAQAAEGLALSLIGLKRPAEAEAVLAPWHDANEGTKKSYMAAIANLLAQQPPPVIAPEVLARIVPAVAAQRDAASAQQLGWYSHAYGQDDTAARWFATALSWKPDDEPSAYGLAVVDQTLNRRDALRSLIRVWASRSLRIRALVDPAAAKILAAQQGTVPNMAAPGVLPMAQTSFNPAAFQAATPGQILPIGQVLPIGPAAVNGQTGVPVPTDYQATLPAANPYRAAPPNPYRATAPAVAYQAAPNPYQAALPPAYAVAPNSYQPAAADIPDPYRSAAVAPDSNRLTTKPTRPSRNAAPRAHRPSASVATASPTTPGNCAGSLAGGWCLMKLNRPAEAAAAFRAALAIGSPGDRQDAAYGLSLAYLRLGLTSDAAAASTQAPQPGTRVNELGTAIMTQRILSDYQAGHYAQVLIGLDARARTAPEQTDLMMMRAWSYYHLQRYNEAQQVFQALATAGNADATQGLAAIRDVKRQR